ncbi:hypothetical protein DPMN_164048 [Dreissena polymorpha]|uniref:Uncharacterized protein n=1 Tax=Dreissena polymorpha TaxID=45954 RepID=A0A9D4ETE5_DREPO|nr:hypothetical protein DPMN_164048 [Dreissena polymorpha]
MYCRVTGCSGEGGKGSPDVAGTQGAPDGAAPAFRPDPSLQRALGWPRRYVGSTKAGCVCIHLPFTTDYQTHYA